MSGETQVYVVFGDEDYLVHSRASELVERLAPGGAGGYAVERIEGSGEGSGEPVETLHRVLEGVRTPGLFGGRRVIWLRAADFLLTATGNDELAQVARLLAEEIKRSLPPGVFLVVTGRRADKRGYFMRACRQVGKIESLEKRPRQWEEEERARALAMRLLADRGLRADDEVVTELVQRTGGESGLLHQEVMKLAAYRHGDEPTVSRDDVRKLVPASREAARWEFADAVAAGDTARALDILRRLLAQRHDPVGLLVGLGYRFRELSILRACLDRGWLRTARAGRRVDPVWTKDHRADRLLGGLPDDPRNMHPYRVLMRLREARRFPLQELLSIRRRIADAHLRMVGGGTQPDLLLEFLVLEIGSRGWGGGERT
ncbi:MAG TPA: DNA polymerase III subunit delta [Kiritimatiellae bacterium]|nr:DNA polymerase III subunit delta [Kiritimatiellia bacterium]